MVNKPASGDLATWAGAFGATVAAVVAVWIALHQRVTQRNTEYAKAVIVAARVILPLSSTAAEIGKLQRWFSQMQVIDFDVKTVTNLVKSVLALKIPIEQELIFHLAPLGDRCVYRIAAAIGTLEALQAIIPNDVNLYFVASDRAQRIKDASFWDLSLNECELNLKRAAAECQRVSHGLTSPNY